MRQQLGQNQIRAMALGRSNWLFAGSLPAGKRAASAMSLLHSARINGHDPYAYLCDVLEPASQSRNCTSPGAYDGDNQNEEREPRRTDLAS